MATDRQPARWGAASGGCSCYVLVSSHDRGRIGSDATRRAARARRGEQPGRTLRALRPRLDRRRLGPRGRNARASHRGGGRAAAQRHHPQHLAGRGLRPLDQPLPGLRARLHLLLRPADARLSRSLAGARLRDPPRGAARGAEGAGGRTGAARLSTRADRPRHQHRPLPADREALRDHARHPRSAARPRAPGDGGDQGGADRARRRHPRRDGPAGSRAGRASR